MSNNQYQEYVRFCHQNESMHNSKKTESEDWFTFPVTYSHLASRFTDNSIFVEVGSWKGRSSVYMAHELLRLNKKTKFYCVDTWEGSDEHKNDSYINNKSLYDIFLKNTEKYRDIIIPIRKLSTEAAKDFSDQSLDAVFIDACHEYECVKEDIHAWIPKIKRGGIICGHDYHWTQAMPVKRAVDEYFGLGTVLHSVHENVWIILL